MKSIKARIQGFAVLPLLVVVFLLAISALGTYIVVKQGTGGYGTRASGSSCSRLRCYSSLGRACNTDPLYTKFCYRDTDGSGMDGCFVKSIYTPETSGFYDTHTYEVLYGCGAGQSCVHSDQCSSGLRCVGGKCTAPTPTPQRCNAGDICCKSVTGADIIGNYQETYYCKDGSKPSTQTSSCKCQRSLTPTPTVQVYCPILTTQFLCSQMPQCIWDRTACKSKIAEGQRCLLLSSAVPCQPGLTCVDDPNSTVSSNGICKKPVTPTPTKKTTPTPKAQPNTCAADSGYQCNQLSNAALKCPDGRVDCKSGLKCVDASGNSVSGTTKTGTCKATTSDPKPTSTPVPGGGGGGGTIPQDSQCTNIGGTCTNVGTAQQCPDVSKPRLLIGYCPSSPSTSIRCCAPATGGGGGGGGNITPSVTPTPTTGGGTGTTGNAVLNFKLKLQGVNSYPKGSKTVAFKVKLQGPTNTDYQSGLLTVDQNLIWSGSTTFSNIVVGPSTKYTVFVKVGKHLQKRVCAFAPSETSGGTYNCSESNMPITAGTNNLDFSGILMLVGDLPSSTGEQNGVVDSYDISYVLNHLGSTVESELGIGDLNFDGVIDTQDRSLIIQSLNVKYDDQ